MSYFFSVSIFSSRFGNVIDIPGAEHIESLLIESKMFEKPEDALQSCKQTVKQLVNKLNIISKEYGYLVELNPSITNQPTVTNNWEPWEYATIWVYPMDSQNKIKDSILYASVSTPASSQPTIH